MHFPISRKHPRNLARKPLVLSSEFERRFSRGQKHVKRKMGSEHPEPLESNLLRIALEYFIIMWFVEQCDDKRASFYKQVNFIL